MHFTHKKWLVIIIIATCLVVFDFMSVQTSIATRAIAVGIALDEIDGNIELSAQVIAHGKTVNNGNNYGVFTASGKTMQDATAQLSKLVGTETSFAHALVLILGKSFLEGDNIHHLEYLFESGLIGNNIQLAAATDSAKELLSTKLAMSETCSYQLTKQLIGDKKISGTNSNNLKKYFMHNFNVGSSSYLPIVKTIETPPINGSETTIDRKIYLLEISTTAVLVNSKLVLNLNQPQSEGLSFVTQKLSSGSISFHDENDKLYQFTLQKSSAKKKVNLKDNSCVIKVTLMLRDNHLVKNRKLNDALSKESKAATKAHVKTIILDCFEVCREKNIDVFAIGESFYAKGGAAWLSENGKTYLQNLTVDVAVELTFV